MKILIATRNQDKVREIEKIWKDLTFIKTDWLGRYPYLKEVEETGKTLEENAAIKAEYAASASGLASVADDTGLFVEYIEGRPGIYSARYAGPDATYADNVKKLLVDLEGVEREKRRAEFRCVVCLSKPGLDNIFTQGVVKGYITEELRGDKGFGYDPVFEVGDTGLTFSEMESEKKNRISHRYIAFKKMGEELSRGVAQFG